mgnify:CR=1 FL=1
MDMEEIEVKFLGIDSGEIEKKLLALDRIRNKHETKELVVMDQTPGQFMSLYKYGEYNSREEYEHELKRVGEKVGKKEKLNDSRRGG